ncbi:MAG: hypothetical protein K6E91_03630 [Butyrivibrio sp.]|nr:hypothetical protein [Butyrivibrio sp.]
MKKKIMALLLVSVMGLSLAACSSEKTSTTTFTTSVTDGNGETQTTTTTTTSENGQTTTEQTTTTTSADGTTTTTSGQNGKNADANSSDGTSAYVPAETDIPTLRDKWADFFNYGAEGKTDQNEQVLFIYDDPDKLSQAAIMIISPDNILTLYDIGNIREDEDFYVIEDVDGDEEVPFSILETADDHFTMGFQDGSKAELYYVDKDTILNDMIGIIEQLSKQQ